MKGNVVHTSEYISVVEYLDGEQEAEERHEFAGGQVYEMPGATELHEIVAGNIAAALLAHLRGKRCRVFKGDMKVHLRLNNTDLFYYPDAMVPCDPADAHPLYKERPRLIVEVMSDYKVDHVEKLFAYQQIETLQEYLVIHQDPAQMRAWLYSKDQNWKVSDGAPDGTIRLASVDFTFPLKELYIME